MNREERNIDFLKQVVIKICVELLCVRRGNSFQTSQNSYIVS
jgi:hypothetical protein